MIWRWILGTGRTLSRGIYVYDDGIVKGMIHVEKREDGIKNLELRELYIDPFFQGEGVGSCLMRAFLSIAEREKAEQVFLWVLEENKKARGFYEQVRIPAIHGAEGAAGDGQIPGKI